MAANNDYSYLCMSAENDVIAYISNDSSKPAFVCWVLSGSAASCCCLMSPPLFGFSAGFYLLLARRQTGRRAGDNIKPCYMVMVRRHPPRLSTCPPVSPVCLRLSRLPSLYCSTYLSPFSSYSTGITRCLYLYTRHLLYSLRQALYITSLITVLLYLLSSMYIPFYLSRLYLCDICSPLFVTGIICRSAVTARIAYSTGCRAHVRQRNLAPAYIFATVSHNAVVLRYRAPLNMSSTTIDAPLS